MNKQKQAGFAHLMIIVAILGLALIGVLIFVFYSRVGNENQNETLLKDYGGGKLSDSAIISRLNKGYGKIVSIKDTKIDTQKIVCPNVKPCNLGAVDYYRYEGLFYVNGMSFGIPFRLDIGHVSDNPTVDIYTGAPVGSNYTVENSASWLNEAKWKSFLAFYNTLGQYDLRWYLMGLISQFKSANVPRVDSSSTLIAGYKYDGLYLVSEPHRSEKGGYLFYFDEQTKQWLVLTDDAEGLISWVDTQMENGIPFGSIDWSQSPIKPNK